MSEPAITLSQIYKSYYRGRTRKGDLRNTVKTLLTGRTTPEKYYALQDVNLTIEQGEVVGLIGPNGAGKSTLLKLLSRITMPSEGKIQIRGTVSSMLEVGTGFHPELSGRENIYLNGAILGMTREEVSRKFDSIVLFAGVEEFLETPVKHYSSGMYVRLAFAVASHLEPDILLLDEVLAVGDQSFQLKSIARLMEASAMGRTIILVSHQMNQLRDLCTRGIFLYEGKVLFDGPMQEAIQAYSQLVEKVSGQNLEERSDRRGSGAIRATRIYILDENQNRVLYVKSGSETTICMEIKRMENLIHHLEIQLEFVDMFGQCCLVSNNQISGDHIELNEELTTITCHFPKFPLNAQRYSIHLSIRSGEDLYDEAYNALLLDVIPGPFYKTGKMPGANSGMLADYTWG